MSFSEEKRKLFEALLREQGLERNDAGRIKRRPRADRAPLSFAQERVWLLDQLLPGSSAYNIPAVVRLRGPLNVDALRTSLTEIARRHETLRTSFMKTDDGPIAVVSDDPVTAFEFRDLSIVAGADREREALVIANAEAKAPFDLSKAPLCRSMVIRIGEEDHFFVLTLHHMVAEAWSVAILYRELETLYAAFAGGQRSPLRELEIQYGDFALWQRQRLAGETIRTEISYWKNQLRNLPVVQLPSDYPRPAMPTSGGAWRSIDFSPGLSARLKTLAQSEGATLYMTLLAAFATLLHRYTGQNDLVIGSPVAGRNSSETENIIGFFVNTLVMRLNATGDVTFREFLRQARDVAFDAYAHQEAPFQKLVQEISSERIRSHTALFQIMFALQTTPIELKLAGMLPAEPLGPSEVHDGGAATDLALVIEERGEVLHAGFEYSTDLFMEETVDRMLRHLEALLQGIIADPDQRISRLPILPPSERDLVVVKWNQTTTSYPRHACIHELFEAQAESTPDAVALVLGNKTMTYRELNARANQLARQLRTLNAEPNVLLGICMDRSLEMVVAILATLKAGSAYLPLDSDYPNERLAFMIQDGQARVILTIERFLASLPATDCPVVCLDRDWPSISRNLDSNLPSTTNAENLAYVMFTSGSTGKPKGACVSHRNVIRLVKNTTYVDFMPDEVMLHMSTISFDASTFELWGCLLNGGRLVLFPSSKPSLEELGQTIVNYGVTTLMLTGGLFRLMVDNRLEDLRGLRQLLTGGEALSVPHMRKAYAELKGCRLINAYGPTEGATCSCCYTITNPERLLTSVPIGPPISNTRVYVLDSYMQPAPIGIPGELYIGGDGLGPGYFNRPELTAEKFVPDPFVDDAKALLYKTGDLTRWLPDGTVEFLGRNDFQVKIRGFRVELGEIEAILGTHTGVRETVVLAREDVPGDKRLVAYIVPHADRTPAVDELRQYLQDRLPGHMTPSAFVFLEQLPLTPNTKVDRAALPAPDISRPALQSAYAVPRTELEARIAAIWQEVLRLDKVGTDDNFFDLGGHSLLLAQVHHRLAGVLDRPIAMLDLFKHPTIRTFAKHVSDSVSTTAASAAANSAADRGRRRRQMLTAQAGFRDTSPSDGERLG